MDVALDSNIYLADPRMEGIAFKSLLDYLRKTQSSLLITKVVFDEVIARYPERVLRQAKRAISESSSLRNLAMVARVKKIPDIDIARESRALKSKLIKPSRYVKSTLLKDFRGISVEEVAKRGVMRIPPANPAGEELRDVMTWLMVVGYAEKSKREIAFVTDDEHFGRANTLHPQLAKEIQDKKVNLHFYESIDEFIKAHAPTPHDLTADESFALVGKQFVLDLFEVEARRFFPRYWRNAESLEIISRDVKFVKGALYDLGAGSQYGETKFAGELKIRVSQNEMVFTNVSANSVSFGNLSSIGNVLEPSARSGLRIFVGGKSQEPEWVDEMDVGLSNTLYVGKPVPLGSMTAVPSISSKFLSATLPSTRVETSTTDFALSGTLVVSMRLVSGRVTNLETENFELADLSRIREVGKP